MTTLEPTPPLAHARDATRRRRHAWAPYFLVGPFFAIILTFGLFPLLFSLYIAFCEWNPASGLAAVRWDGLWAFRNVLTDPFFWPALWRSLSTGLAASVPQHLIALPLAFGIHLVFRRVQGLIGTALFLPYVTSPLAAGASLGLAFMIVWQPLEALLGLLQGIPALGALLPTGDSGVPFDAFRILWTTLGWNVLLYLMALGTIPRSLYEAAQVDGANLWRQFRFITLPLVRPMIFVAFTMSFLGGVQANVFQPGFSGLREMNVPSYAFRTAFFDMDFGLAAAQTWVFFASMVLVVLLAYWWFGRNFTSLDVSAHGEREDGPLHLHAVALVVLKIVLALAVALSIIPVLAVLLNATRSAGWMPLAVGQEFYHNYDDLLERVPNFWRNVWNTTYVSTLAAAGAMVTTSLAAYAFALLDFRYRRPLYLSVLCIMLFPSLLNLIPTAMITTVFGWVDQARAIWVPATASAFGVFLTTQYMTSAIPRSIIEAARIDGAGNLTVLRRIVVPLAMPVLVTVGLITFIGTWNNTMSALAVLRTPETQSVLQALSTVIRPGGEGRSAFLFGVAVATLPTLLLFALTARQITRAMNLTSSTARPEARSTPAERAVPSSGFLAGADGVRAVACLMVILHHLSQRLDGQAQLPLVREVQAYLMNGHVGVSAFFVLSGMLLSLPFWRRYLAGQPRPGLREYARRRAVRIVPGFYAALAVSFLFTLALVPDAASPWLRLVSAATFTSPLHYVTFFPTDLNGPLWSIGFEVICYLLMPLAMLGLFAFLPRRGPAVAFAYWLAVFALTLVAHQWVFDNLQPDRFGRGWQFGLIGGAKLWMPHYNVIGMYGHYILGVLAAGLIALGQQRRLQRHWLLDVLALAGLGAMLLLLWETRRATEFSFSIGRQPYYFPWFPLTVALMLAALPFSRFVARAFDNPFFRYTAKVSFGLYIWHYLILELMRLLHNPRFAYAGISDLPHWLLLSGVALLLAYAAASLSYRHIEEPFLKGGPAKPGQLQSPEPALVAAPTGTTSLAAVIGPAPHLMTLSGPAPSSAALRWHALRERLDPANDAGPPPAGLIAARWGVRLAPWLVAALTVWLYLGSLHVNSAHLNKLIQTITSDPNSIPVKSYDGAHLYRYEYTDLGTTTLVWRAQDDWWLRLEAPRYRLDDLVPQRELVRPDGEIELYRVTGGPLEGHYVLRAPTEINVYSPGYYEQHSY